MSAHDALNGQQFGVSLDRNRGIEGFTPREGHSYRMLGQAGYDALHEHGTVTSRDPVRYPRPYFGPAPLARYATKRANVDYFAEVPNHLLTESGNGYGVPQRPLMRSEVTVYQHNRRTGEVRGL